MTPQETKLREEKLEDNPLYIFFETLDKFDEEIKSWIKSL